jgi:hypothetical protein
VPSAEVDEIETEVGPVVDRVIGADATPETTGVPLTRITSPADVAVEVTVAVVVAAGTTTV